MIIRSQNKKAIVNLNVIDTIEEHNKHIRYFGGGGMETVGVLGKYSTEEKAIKVLDMICAEYQYAEECKHTGVGSAPPEFVFQMPSDEEVEV